MRHTLQSLFPENRRYGGNFSPAQKLHAVLIEDNLKEFLCLIAFKLVLREKEHSDTEITLAADIKAKLCGFGSEKIIRYLNKNTNAVTGFSLCVLTCTVFKLFNDRESILNNLSGALSLDIYYSADSAVIVLELGAVKSLLSIRFFNSEIIHIVSRLSDTARH